MRWARKGMFVFTGHYVMHFYVGLSLATTSWPPPLLPTHTAHIVSHITHQNQSLVKQWEQGPRLSGDRIRIHNGIVSPPSLYSPALHWREASGEWMRTVWATIDMAWWANHILLNASARPAPSQNSSWLGNSFIVSVHPGVPCWSVSWNLLNQLWKLFREVNKVFWNPGSSRCHSDLFLKESLSMKHDACSGKLRN